MIAYLRGRLVHRQAGSIVLETQGIGYQLFIPPGTEAEFDADEEVLIHTYLHVRDDALLLYGFPDPLRKQLFEQLMTVSGVGPKLALTMVGVEPEELRRRVVSGDEAALTRIPGIGKKTAQRLILELRDRWGALPDVPGTRSTAASAPAVSHAMSQLLEALGSLGYRDAEVAAALERAGLDGNAVAEAGVEASLRMLLKEFGPPRG